MISQLGARISQQFAEHLQPFGLRPAHFGVLVRIARDEGQSQQQLADHVGVHRNVMVSLVDDLEERGLVERRRHPEDRRAHAIHLTEAAVELLPRAEEVAAQFEASLFADIDPADHALVLDVLRRVSERAGLVPELHPALIDSRRPAPVDPESC